MKTPPLRLTPLIALSAILALNACTDGSVPFGPKTLIPAEASRLTVPAIGVYTQIQGSYPTCGLRNDGVLRCWKEGQTTLERAATASVFTKFKLSLHTCALRADSAVECWGDNSKGQAPPVVTPPSGMQFIDLALGNFYSCALRNDGVIQCWGEESTAAPPTLNATSGLFVAVAASSNVTCGLTNFGVIECFGNAGHFTFTPSTGSFTRIVSVINLCGIRTGGIVECRQTPNYQTVPLPGPFVDYALNGIDQCGITLSGAVQCISTGEPYMINGLSGPVAQMALGGFSFCALLTSGTIQCTGLLARSDGAYERVLPTATFSAPLSVIVGQPISLGLTNAQVPGYPQETLFKFAFDCGSGTFSPSEPGTEFTATCPTSATGTRVVRGKVVDRDHAESIYSATVTIKNAQQATIDLAAEIQLAPLAPDIRKALSTKLDAALTAIAKGKANAACSALRDFINQVNAQRGKAIPTTTADSWILTAQQLMASIGC